MEHFCPLSLKFLIVPTLFSSWPTLNPHHLAFWQSTPPSFLKSNINEFFSTPIVWRALGVFCATLKATPPPSFSKASIGFSCRISYSMQGLTQCCYIPWSISHFSFFRVIVSTLLIGWRPTPPPFASSTYHGKNRHFYYPISVPILSLIFIGNWTWLRTTSSKLAIKVSLFLVFLFRHDLLAWIVASFLQF